MGGDWRGRAEGVRRWRPKRIWSFSKHPSSPPPLCQSHVPGTHLFNTDSAPWRTTNPSGPRGLRREKLNAPDSRSGRWARQKGSAEDCLEREPQGHGSAVPGPWVRLQGAESPPHPPSSLQCKHRVLTRTDTQPTGLFLAPTQARQGVQARVPLDPLPPAERPRQERLSPPPKRRSPGARRHVGPAPSQESVLAEKRRESLPRLRAGISSLDSRPEIM